MLLCTVVFFSVSLTTSTALAAAPDAQDFIDQWIDRPSARPWSLSPDGERVVTVESDGAVIWLRLITLADGSETRLPVAETAPGTPLPPNWAAEDETLRFFRPTGSVIAKWVESGVRNAITSVQWKSDQRLVFSSSMGSLMWAINDDGSDPMELLPVVVEASPTRNTSAAMRWILDLLPDTPNLILVQARALYFDHSVEGFYSGVKQEVYLVDVTEPKVGGLTNGGLKDMFPLVDRNGYVRGGLATDWDNLTQEVYFWNEATKEVVSATARFGDEESQRNSLFMRLRLSGSRDYALFGWVFDPKVLYVVHPTDTGASGVYAFDVDTGLTGAPAFESPDFDLSGGQMIQDSFRRSVIGFRYNDIVERSVWFDQGFAQVQATLDQSLPQRTNRIINWDRTRSRFLFQTSSDRDFGGIGLFDTRAETGQLKVLSPLKPRPGVASRTAPIWLPIGDEKLLCYLTTGPGRTKEQGPASLVVVLGDVADERSYWLGGVEAQYLAASGYSVLRVNPRGLAGLTAPGGRLAAEALLRRVIDDTTSAVRWAVQAGLADPRAVHLAAADFGGYAGLLMLAEEPDLFASAIIQRAVTDPLDWMKHLANANKFSAIETARFLDFARERWGDPRQDKQGLRDRSPLHLAERIRTPLLLIHGADGKQVPLSQPQDLHAKLTKLKRHPELFVIDDTGDGPWPFDRYQEILVRMVEFLESHPVGPLR